MKVYFDVGANEGNWGIEKAQDPNAVVYAFEPTPTLAGAIRSQTEKLSNYFLIEKAVSDKEGKFNFNLAAGSGCSSLLDIKPPQILNETWPGRTDLVKIGAIEVECIRMDAFCKDRGITRIDFFHCDTQGYDLNVLKSFGSYLHIIEEGEIETAISTGRAIYENQDNTIETCEQFFKANGFTIVKIWENDIFRNEFNIHFKKIK